MVETTYPVMIDPVTFDHKPTNPETRDITTRLKYQPTIRNLTAEQLRAAIVSGHTVCYGCFDPCKQGEKFGQSRFIGQRLMAMDIDNTRSSDKTPIQFWEYGFLSVRQAINRCLYGLGQLPIIVYESFSSTEHHPKFRIVIDLGEVIADYDEAHEQILDTLASFPEADRSGKCKNPDGLFFGTNPENGKYWNEDVLRKWPNADAS